LLGNDRQEDENRQLL